MFRTNFSRFSGLTVNTRIWRLFAIAVCAVLLLVGALFAGLQRVKADRAAIARTAHIDRVLSALERDLLDAETGQRGYLLTRDDKYLEPYTSSSVDAPLQLATLRQLTSNHESGEVVEKIPPVVFAKLAELAQTVALARAGDPEAAMRIVKAGTGNDLIKTFRVLSQRIVETQSVMFARQRARAETSMFDIALILAIGGSVTIGMLFLYTRRTSEKLGRPITALVEGMLAVAGGSVDHRLTVVTPDEIGAMASAFNAMTERLATARAAERAASLELRISHEAMRLSEQRLLLVTDNFPGLIAHVDSDLRYRFVNRGYADWFDTDRAAIVGTSLQDFYGAAAFAGLERSLQNALSGSMVTDEGELNTRVGVRHCHVVFIPQHGESGDVKGLFLIHTDITQRREAELALRESQDFLARTGEAAGVGGWELDLTCGRLTWSAEVRRLHDVDENFVTTLDGALRFYTEGSRAAIQQAVDDCIRLGRPYDEELELISATGRRFWARATGTAEFEDGIAIRLVGAFQDITERRQLQRELAESYDLVRVTLDSIGDAVITTDQQGCVQWLNPVAETMVGWSKEDARSKPLEEVFNILNAETRQVSTNPVAMCLDQGRTAGPQSNTTLVSRTGKEYGIEDSASPIRSAEGKILGAVLVFHDVTEQRRLSREMSHRAAHDSLTGLVNRAEFETRLSRLLAATTLDGGTHIVMFIDLDAFKVVNDACGHSAGDQLLRQVSALFLASVRGRDTVARLGGDEFGVILENCSIEQGQVIAQKICEQMESYRFTHDGKRYRVGTSIGVVPVDVRWASSAAVMQAADSCCYAAKDAGRNRVHLWVESDSAIQVRQGEMQWVNRLEAAMDENRFVLFAQHIEPIDGPGSGLHCEVLLRLQDDDGSLVQPGAFLPSAERFHLASRIDRWVVHRVFELLHAEATSVEHIDTIAINLSGQSIGDRAFHRDLIRMIHDARFDVRKLCFEITETTAITNLGDAKGFIEELRLLGARIALDDFGAGASSFGYLRMLPVDYLKIDGQFITRLLDDALDNAAVRCFCEVAKVVGVQTIAEFVESADVRDALRQIGVDLAQGYLIHRAEPLVHLLPTRASALAH